MSVHHVVGATEKEPRIRLVAEPVLSATLQRELACSRAALEAHPDHFDGPALILLEVSVGEVVGYQGSYAHYRTVQRLGPETALGLGTAGIGLILFDGQGRELWAKRSEHVDQPGSWCYALGGGVARAEDGFRGSILVEAREELALAPAQLQELKPCVLLQGGLGAGGYLVFTALLKPGSKLQFSVEEVGELRWVSDPLLELTIDPLLADLYRTAHDYLPRSRLSAAAPSTLPT